MMYKGDRGSSETMVATPDGQPAIDEIENCKFVSDSLLKADLWRVPGHAHEQERIWRISPEPFELSEQRLTFLKRLGPALHAFYSAANALYLRGSYPWFNDYLDSGKPQSLIDYGHMNFQRRRLPLVIRPDIILGEDVDYITEVDSVPGGIGQTDCLSAAYEQLGYDLIGGSRGMLNGFASAIRSSVEHVESPALAIIVSEESEDYRPEMQWIARQLEDLGWRAFAVRPEEVVFKEEGLFVERDGVDERLDVIYRFFELFDLKNIPKAELVMYAAKKKRVVVTPPYKTYLEEKSLLALFHHPLLESYWRSQIGDDSYDFLGLSIPRTWILDDRPLPPYATIPGFTFRGEPVGDWRVIKEGTQKERRLVIKPSGFSPLAWGSRGVVVGHDVSHEEWAMAVENALQSFNTHPYVLQHFHEGTRVEVKYQDQQHAEIKRMSGRVRLSPYYFVSNGEVKLGGALATICSLDKKLIHGMTDAVMVPCAVERRSEQS